MKRDDTVKLSPYDLLILRCRLCWVRLEDDERNRINLREKPEEIERLQGG